MDKRTLLLLVLLSLFAPGISGYLREAYRHQQHDLPEFVDKKNADRFGYTFAEQETQEEPTCEQLRLLWRLSLREQRNQIYNNMLPRSHDAFLLGRISQSLRHNSIYNRPRAPSHAVYGTVVRDPAERRRYRHRLPAINELSQVDDSDYVRSRLSSAVQLPDASVDGLRTSPSFLDRQQSEDDVNEEQEDVDDDAHYGTVRMAPHSHNHGSRSSLSLLSRQTNNNLPISHGFRSRVV